MDYKGFKINEPELQKKYCILKIVDQLFKQYVFKVPLCNFVKQKGRIDGRINNTRNRSCDRGDSNYPGLKRKILNGGIYESIKL